MLDLWIGLLCWIGLGVPVALVIGSVTRRRDTQVPLSPEVPSTADVA